MSSGPRLGTAPATTVLPGHEPVQRAVHVVVGDRSAVECHEGRPSSRRPESIDGSVPGDRVQPGRQRSRPRVERLGPVPQSQEGLLDHFLGDPAVGCQPIDQRRRSRRHGGRTARPALLRIRRPAARRGPGRPALRPERSPSTTARQRRRLQCRAARRQVAAPGVRRGADHGDTVPWRAHPRPRPDPRGTHHSPARIRRAAANDPDGRWASRHDTPFGPTRASWRVPAGSSRRSPSASSIDARSAGKPEPDRARARPR